MVQVKCDYSGCYESGHSIAEVCEKGWFEITISPFNKPLGSNGMIVVKKLNNQEPVAFAALHACNEYHATCVVRDEADGLEINPPKVEATAPAIVADPLPGPDSF